MFYKVILALSSLMIVLIVLQDKVSSDKTNEKKSEDKKPSRPFIEVKPSIKIRKKRLTFKKK